MQHKLIFQQKEKTFCLLCQQTWKTKPKKECPGVPVQKNTLQNIEELSQKFWLIDSLVEKNLRPLNKVCCVKQGKNYLYFYDKKGKTEKINSLLPPVVKALRCDETWEWETDSHCLKSEIGLKKLNLLPGKAQPVAVYYCYSKKNFIPLYNPLDCEIYYFNLPPLIDYYDLKYTDLLDYQTLAKFNLKPRANTFPLYRRWNNSLNDWDFYWDIKQTELNNKLLPPVFETVTENYSLESQLFEFNRKYSKLAVPVGCIWHQHCNNNIFGFEYFYDPNDCDIKDTSLPPVLPFNYHYSSSKEPLNFISFLKNEIGLKKLNLQPEQARPVAVYYNKYHNHFYLTAREFIPLYNPLDCEAYLPNLPFEKYFSHYQIPQILNNNYHQFFSNKEIFQLNLKPREGSIPCLAIWNDNSQVQDWELFYVLLQLEILDKSLPPVVKKQPPNLFKTNDFKLVLLNRKVTQSTPVTACIFENYTNTFTSLYKSEDCELINPQLPICYLKEEIPQHLKSEWAWRQSEPLYQLKPNAEPKGCFLLNTRGNVVALYDRSSLELHNRDVYLSKTKLKQNYYLSPKLLKLLGSPDKIEPLEIKGFAVEAHLYKRSRIEKFLADRAALYADHLAKREIYLAIFEQNKDKLLSPLARAKAKRTKKYKKKAPVVTQQFDWDIHQKKVLAQSIKCLQCASAIASPDGFLCVIHPYGFDPDKIPCSDWQAKF